MFLFTSEFECSLTGGKIRFSICSGLGSLDVVVLCARECFLTSFFFAILESSEAVLILVREREDLCPSKPGAHTFRGIKKPLGAVLVNFRCGGISVRAPYNNYYKLYHIYSNRSPSLPSSWNPGL